MGVDTTAYVDDSGKEHEMFCLAGYLAPAAEWVKLEGPWEKALRKEGLTEFKARNCEQGEGEFEGRTPEQRQQIQRRFISLINSVRVHGVYSGIDLKAYEEEADHFKLLTQPGYWKAYFRVFGTQIQVMAAQVKRFSEDERIGFVFDQGEFAGRAANLFTRLKDDQGFGLSDRLGSFISEDSKLAVPLQAADLLAYEAYRWLTTEPFVLNVPPDSSKMRWQLKELQQRTIQGTIFHRTAIHEYRDLLYGAWSELDKFEEGL